MHKNNGYILGNIYKNCLKILAVFKYIYFIKKYKICINRVKNHINTDFV